MIGLPKIYSEPCGEISCPVVVLPDEGLVSSVNGGDRFGAIDSVLYAPGRVGTGFLLMTELPLSNQEVGAWVISFGSVSEAFLACSIILAFRRGGEGGSRLFGEEFVPPFWVLFPIVGVEDEDSIPAPFS